MVCMWVLYEYVCINIFVCIHECILHMNSDFLSVDE